MASDLAIVAASAQRLQASIDQRRADRRQLSEAQAAKTTLDKQVEDAARKRADIYSQNRQDALNAQADQQRIQERNRQQDLIAQNDRNAKIDAATQDAQDFVARTQQQAQADRNAVQAQITQNIYDRQRLNAPSSASVSFDAYLKDRNNRLNERAALDAQRSASSAQDYARSARSAETVRTDPSQIPDNQIRGGIVDFSA